MTIDPQFALTIALPLARAAYGHDVDTNPPAGWSGCCLIQPDYFGFCASGVNGLGCIAFRGTETPGEWVQDFAAIPTPNLHGQGTVHLGFQDVYEKIRSAVVENLRKLETVSEVIIIGHSLGGALALLCAADLAQSRTVSVVTFATPNVGKKDFCCWADSHIKQCLNLANVYDLVPRVPLANDGWLRPGNDVLLHPRRPQGQSLHDLLRNAHALDAYQEGLEKYGPVGPEIAEQNPIPDSVSETPTKT